MELESSIFELEDVPISNWKIHGQVLDIHITRYGNIKATIRLSGHRDTPVVLEFPLTMNFDADCPIKLNDWITVETKVTRFGEPKK